MSREWLVRIGTLVWLAVVFTAAWGDASAANLLGGLVVGGLIMVSLPLPRVPVHGTVRILPLLELLAATAFYAIESSVQIAWFAVRPAGPPVSGVLRVRLRIDSDLVLVLCADVLNVIPGTMVLELNREAGAVWVHVLDVGSDRAVAKFYRVTHRLEHLLISAFERGEEIREVR
ncbi:MAG: Na+/H+ antiporter subunit E [Nocardia sp.]|nr:Na+/H+ antiporter subunit E [Nocardia sp.]